MKSSSVCKVSPVLTFAWPVRSVRDRLFHKIVPRMNTQYICIMNELWGSHAVQVNAGPFREMNVGCFICHNFCPQRTMQEARVQMEKISSWFHITFTTAAFMHLHSFNARGPISWVYWQKVLGGGLAPSNGAPLLCQSICLSDASCSAWELRKILGSLTAACLTVWCVVFSPIHCVTTTCPAEAWGTPLLDTRITTDQDQKKERIGINWVSSSHSL